MKYSYGEFTQCFKALADETRLKIIDMLSSGEMCACKILENFNITQPTLSYHMKILCDSGIVNGRREGAWMYYSINSGKFEDILEFIINVKSGGNILKEKLKVAFVCVHNSCRSQMAEALGKKLASDVFESFSAGSETKPNIDKDAVRIMKKLYDIDMETSQYSKLISDIPKPDIVITMGCNVNCPYLPCRYRQDWGLEDPTGKSENDFIVTARKIEDNILILREKIENNKLW